MNIEFADIADSRQTNLTSDSEKQTTNSAKRRKYTKSDEGNFSLQATTNEWHDRLIDKIKTIRAFLLTKQFTGMNWASIYQNNRKLTRNDTAPSVLCQCKWIVASWRTMAVYAKFHWFSLEIEFVQIDLALSEDCATFGESGLQVHRSNSRITTTKQNATKSRSQ